MKLPLLANLNEIGLRGAADRALLAAHWLKIATVSSPAVTITPAVPAIVAKPEIIAQTAKPARAATAAVAANPANPAHPFGTLFLNSPAFAAGAALPAFPAKPASAVVAGVPAVVGVPAVPAVMSPAILAVKGWEDAITINKTVSNIEIIAYLPYTSSPLLVGASTSGIGAINEMTAASLIPGKWLGTKSSENVGTEIILPTTVERYLYKQALEFDAYSRGTALIENSTKVVNGVTTPCKKLTLQLSTLADYTLGVEDLQLGKLGRVQIET